MTDKLHSLFTNDDGIHIAHAWTCALYADRAALDLTPADVGKLAFVVEDLTFWVLCDDDGGEGPIWKNLTFIVDPGSATAAIGSANSAGVSDAYAREDHVHDGVSQTLNDQTGTTYTIQASDVGKLVRCTNAAAITVTVPDTFTIAAGTRALVNVLQGGAGQVTVVGSGTRAMTSNGLTNKTRGQGAEIFLSLTGATACRVGGDVAAV
jgi:hypothetical protein